MDHLLDKPGRQLLADTLGDTPEAVISIHKLRRGLCDAYVVGEPSNFDGAVLQSHELPGEPTAFGDDPVALWRLLRGMRGWTCVNVPATCAPALGELIEGETGEPVRYYGDVYHTLTRPAARLEDEAVRRLEISDLTLLRTASPRVRVLGFGSVGDLLQDGFVAGAVVSGELVALSFTSAVTKSHTDIAVATLEGCKNRGFATAAAFLVTRLVRESGRTPVWSAGEDNVASLRVARKLGFEEVLRRVYVMPHVGFDTTV